YLLSLLRGKDGAPSGMALEFRDKFDEVYIDEYQDVDEMQDEIFRLVGDDHRFMVGDIKQSIYGFRGADPSVFARYRRNLTQLTPTENSWTGHDESGNSIFMSENFRCDEAVIRVTNAVCGHMLRACPESVGYQDGDDLVFGKKPPNEAYVSPMVKVSVLVKPPKAEENEEFTTDATENDEELSGVGAEAAYVANEIASLLRSRTPKANGEPITPGDIVILMRSRTALSAYMRALTAMGIPTGSEELEAAEAGKDILHGTDMSYLVNLLRVIDNPDSDIPLSEVLRAPFPGLDLEELIAVRNVGDRTAESRSLYAGVEEYPTREDADPVLAQKLTDFMAWLDHYRRLTATQPADGILRLLRRDEKCACRETQAFLYLYESARTCRTSAFLSLYAFLRYFESKMATAKNIPVPEKSEDGGHVSIMTIHKSKGLEFPVCFVVRCGQYFSAKSYSSDLIFEKRAGVSMKLYHREASDEGTRQYKTDTTLRAVSALAVKLSEREEEMRVLYVAMTRARERLYLVGMGNEKPVSFCEGDRFATLSCNNYLKWILAGLEAHPEVGDFAQLTYLSTANVTTDSPLDRSHYRENVADGDRAVSARYTAILENRTALSPLEIALRRVPTKVPASRMKAGMLDDCVFYETDLEANDGKLPDSGSDGTWCDAQSIAAIRQSLSLMASSGNDEFELLLNQNRRPTATERGTATHLFLQYCDYRLVRSDGIDSEIARLSELGFISERTAAILDKCMLNAFFDSSFFANVLTAKQVERELRFARFVPLAGLTTNTELAEALGTRTLFVQGSIDLLATFPDGHMELCDYKTDHITAEERRDPALLQARMTAAHRDQLLQYAAAVEEMYGRRPTKAYIFSLPLGEALEIPL
ncbi:MAG: UvrD-helicase domain-containing protein, partial [Clostridia bacterium]|nr:UvrD-helicase domain-containing protein [Clostridia bacterium]